MLKNFSKPHQSMMDFILDFDEGVIGLAGPIGTGKTHSVVFKMFLMMISIKPMPDGVRRTRFLIARTVAGDIKKSIINDIRDFFGELFELTSNQSPMTGEIRFNHQGCKIECDLSFYAFESTEDTDKVKSQNFTCFFFIEAQMSRSVNILRDGFSRCGRFPPNPLLGGDLSKAVEENPAIVWENEEFGVKGKGKIMILDFNYVSKAHHFYHYMVRDNHTKGYRRLYELPKLFTPIPVADWDHVGHAAITQYRGEDYAFIRNKGVNELTAFNGWSYFETLLTEYGGDTARIDTLLIASWSSDADGKPVYPMYREDVHTSKQELMFVPNKPIYVGVDNGMNNSWSFFQINHLGQMALIKTISNADNPKSIKSAVEDDIKPFIMNHLMDYTILFILDQSFFSEEAGYGTRQVDPLTEAGFEVVACPYKQTTPIRQVVEDSLRKGLILINKTEIELIDGLKGGFHYPIVRSTGRFSTTPEKNKYSHIVESLEFAVSYMMDMTSNRRKRKPKRKKKKYNYL